LAQLQAAQYELRDALRGAPRQRGTRDGTRIGLSGPSNSTTTFASGAAGELWAIPRWPFQPRQM
jgi:hypothetical protein